MRFLFLFFVVALGLAAWLAKAPKNLDDWKKQNEKPPLTVNVPQKIEDAAPEPEKIKDLPDPLAKLAPESFQTDPNVLNSGFGMGFGSGGPALGSATGGLGRDMNQMVRDQTALTKPARAIFREPLEYPQEAKQRGVTGHVTLKLKIQATGSLEDVQVEEANPSGVFENAAINAVRQWRFDPAFVKGQATASWLVQKIRFEMN